MKLPEENSKQLVSLREHGPLSGSGNSPVTHGNFSAEVALRKTLKQESLFGAGLQDDAFFTYENQLDASLMTSASNGLAQIAFTNEAAPPFKMSSFNVAASSTGNPDQLIEGDFAITRDVNGEIASIEVGGNTVFTKSYDPAGRLTNAAAGSFSTVIGYDPFGRKEAVAHSTGETGTYQYDLLNRVTSIGWTGGTPLSESLTYDLAGNITNVSRENGAYTVAYDAIDQLVSSSTTGSANYERSFGYDLVGNRVSDSQNGAGVFQANFLLSNGVSSFTAQDRGMGEVAQETTAGITTSYTYRADGLLTNLSRGGKGTTYKYDALGRRTAKTVVENSTVIRNSFLHLGAEDRILQARAGDGTIYTYLDGQGVDEHLGQVEGSNAKGYLTDHLGSVLNGEAAGASHSFGLFGENTSTTPPAISASSNPVMYGFTGREYDAESGLNYHRARMYSSTIGRWLSQDPIGIQGGLNIYGYGANSPLLNTDPFGLSYLIFDPNTNMILVVGADGRVLREFPASNNPSSSAPAGRVPEGTFSISHYNEHPESNASGPYGSFGIFVFNFPNGSGIGVHSGREGQCDRANRCGYQHATMGCIRTVDDATSFLIDLFETDPLTHIVVNARKRPPMSSIK